MDRVGGGREGRWKWGEQVGKWRGLDESVREDVSWSSLEYTGP